MSQENVEAFKRGLDAYNRLDLEAMVEGVYPEIEWQPGTLTGLGGEAAVYRGHEGLREGNARPATEAMGESRLEYPEIRDLGDRIVGIGRVCARGRESKAETDSPTPRRSDFKNGRAIRVWLRLRPEGSPRSCGAVGVAAPDENGVSG